MSPDSLVLDHDHMHLLQGEQERQGDHRRPGAGQQIAQPGRGGSGRAGRQAVVERPGQHSATATSAERASEEGAGHVKADRHEASSRTRDASRPRPPCSRRRCGSPRSPAAPRARPTASSRACT